MIGSVDRPGPITQNYTELDAIHHISLLLYSSKDLALAISPYRVFSGADSSSKNSFLLHVVIAVALCSYPSLCSMLFTL